VTLAVPPATLDPVLFSDYEQLKRFFYIFLFRETPGLAEKIVAADGMAFIRRLWQDWSPGFDAADCIEQVRESLADPASLSAAISYYRAPQAPASPSSAGPHEAEAQATARRAPQPTLYLHGAADGCISVDLVRNAGRHLAPDSRMTVIQGAGHFLQVEQPAEVNQHILAWVTS
jgi:pimeloyl-ACP methyl ester carboxylesterase